MNKKPILAMFDKAVIWRDWESGWILMRLFVLVICFCLTMGVAHSQGVQSQIDELMHDQSKDEVLQARSSQRVFDVDERLKVLEAAHIPERLATLENTESTNRTLLLAIMGSLAILMLEAFFRTIRRFAVPAP